MIDDPLFFGVRDLSEAIDELIQHKHFLSSVILMFCGIDALAHLSRTADKDIGSKDDFLKWVNKYFKIDGETDITGDEWWAARNAVVHTLGGQAKAHSNNIRVLSYMVEGFPPIKYNPKVSESLVIVDILAMKAVFDKGIYESIISMHSDSAIAPLLPSRIETLFITTKL